MISKQLKDPRDIVSGLYKKYVTKEDNVIHAEKIFFVNGLIREAFKKEDQQKIIHELMVWGEAIPKYLNNELDMVWKDGNIVVTKVGGVELPTGG